MKKTFTFIFSIVCVLKICAQQLPVFTQYREYNSIINPAAVNMDYLLYNENMFFSAHQRMQWLGVPESPSTQLVNFEHLYNNRGGVSPLYGGSILNDRAGRMSMTGLYGKLAMILSPDTYDQGFVMGMSAGLVQYRLKLDDVASTDPIAAENHNAYYPDVAVGLFYYKRLRTRRNQSIFYGGISIPQVFGLKLQYSDTELTEVRRIRHYYGRMGYIQSLNDENSFVEFSSQIRYLPHVPIFVDLNFRYQIGAPVWIGVGASTSYNLHLEGGLNLAYIFDWDAGVKLGFGMDLPFASYRREFGNAYEINLTYSLQY